MAYEFEPPIEIIQHIQSFLCGKEAARTCISKSWFTAWSTRPDLYFNNRDFNNSKNSYEFLKFSRKTIQRYKDLNLRPENFILSMDFSYYGSDAVLADELITDVLKLGASELVLILNDSWDRYVVPAQVFAARWLMRLCVHCGEISQLMDGRVLFSCLKSLELSDVALTDDIVRNILLGCPLIEKLIFSHCDGLTNLNVSNMLNIVEFRVETNYWTRVEFDDVSIGLATHITEFRYLRQLTLEGVKVSNDFFTKFSSRFPCVVDLTLKCWNLRKVKQISSHSLRCVSLDASRYKFAKLQFNVPNISRFVLKDAVAIPLLSFPGVSKEWESVIEIYSQDDSINSGWFVKLRKLLSELRLSRITLSIRFWSECYIPILEMKPPCFPLPVVENFIVCMNLSPPAIRNFLRGLLECCRPNFITQSKCSLRNRQLDCLRELFKILIHDGDKSLRRRYNLKEVNVELFKEDCMEWQTFSYAEWNHYNAEHFKKNFMVWESVTNIPDDTQIRFRFSWE